MLKVSPKIEKIIQQKVASGKYPSEEAVIESALEALFFFEDEEEEIRAKIEEARESIKRGEGVPAEKVIADLRAKHRAELEKRTE